MECTSNIAVSVLCLAYNHEKYIRETLEGFVMQKTDFSFEVIINDDCSTDATASIIREYEEKYPGIIRPIYQGENQYSKGVQIIKDILVPKANGEYLAFCEGDDYWNDAYKLQKQYDVLQVHQECSMSTHKVKCCNEDGSPNDRIIPEGFYGITETGIIDKDILKNLLFVKLGCPFHTSSYFVRKEIFDSDIHFPRDIGIMRRSLYSGLTYYFNESMSTRRLWSIGNWNSRLKDAGEKGQVELLINDFESEKSFDKDTNLIYHDIIQVAELLRILQLAFYDVYCSKNILIDYLGEIKKFDRFVFKEICIKQTIKYVFLRWCPYILKFHYTLKKRYIRSSNETTEIDKNLGKIG